MNLLPLLLASASLSAGHRLRATRDDRRPHSFRQVLKNVNNVQYVGDIEIGGQALTGIFDTGSFELIVRSSKCEDCAQPTAPYSSQKSKTYEANGTLMEHVYGSGPAKTVLSYETVSVGKFEATHQAIWEITEHNIDLMNTANFAAIVGIGPGFGYTATDKTLLMSFHINRFSICLDKRSGHDGLLQWGRQEALHDDQMVTAKVHGKYHWSTRLSNVTFGAGSRSTGDNFQALCSGQEVCSVVVDSGTSLIAVPTSALGLMQMQIPPVKEDCSNLHELPTLHFKLDGKELTLPPQAYVMRIKGNELDASIWDLLFFKPSIRKVDSCVLAFMELDMLSSDGAQTWILGMPFFRYYHTTFDRQDKVMRFARAGHNCKAEPLKASGNEVDTSFVSSESDAYTPLDMKVTDLLPPRIKNAKEL